MVLLVVVVVLAPAAVVEVLVVVVPIPDSAVFPSIKARNAEEHREGDSDNERI